MKQRKQSSTNYPILFYMVLSSDHVTPATGKTVTVTLSKNGGAFGSANGAVSEIGSGWYSLAANATDRDTLGELAVRASATSCDDGVEKYVIVPWDPFDAVRMGLSALPNAAAGASGGVPVIGSAPLTYLTGDAYARIGTNGSGLTALALATDVATILSALTTIASYIDTEVAAILAAVDTEVAALPSAAAVADAVWDEALSGHTAVGGAGKALADAGGGGVDYDAMIAALAAAGYTVVDTDSVTSSAVSKRRGDVWTVAFTDLGALGTWTKLWLTIKSGHSDADASATVQILLTNPVAGTDGLQRLNGTAATPAQGSLVVDDSASGDITATIAAVATAQLAPGLYYFDVQILRAAGTTTLAEGTWTVRPDATRATS